MTDPLQNPDSTSAEEPDRPGRGLAVAATGAGAAVLATAASACCVPVVAPLIIALFGVSGAVWAAGLKPYSPWILLVAGLFLVLGFWTVYRRRPAPAGVACPVKPARSPRIILWIAAVLWLGAFFLNLVQYLA